MRLADLKDKRIAIWGMGVEGQAMLSLLNKLYPSNQPMIIDNDKVPDGAEVIIRSPGVSIYGDEIIKASSRGVKFTSLINLFLAEVNAAEHRPQIIAVTGTKGKSTTVSALAFMLEKLGYKVGLGGNIGVTPLDFLGQDLDYIVLELSSFQISDLNERVDVGVVVNISRAHVDWHRTIENYTNDKLRLVSLADRVVLNEGLRHMFVTPTPSLPSRGGGGLVFYDNKDGFHVENGKIFDGLEEIVFPKLQIVGDHNLSNLCADFSVLKILGLDYKKAASYLGEFKPLAHRLDKVYEKDGLVFIDDSIATVPESVMAAINAFADKDVALIIGGYDNGEMDYGRLSEFIENAPQVKVAICLPDTGKMVKSSKAVLVKTMREAVEEAIRRIGSGVVLLSPAAPSFNMYKNYKERGNDFAKKSRDIMRARASLRAAEAFPDKPSNIVAVTGTNGKTSVVAFFKQIIELLGKPAATIGTLGLHVGDTLVEGKNTTPGPDEFHKMLSDLAHQGVDYAAFEASSHGLDQHRTEHVLLKAAGFTNLTRDHIDYHGTMEEYFEAKKKLFFELLDKDGVAVLNADIPEFEELAKCGRKVFSYGYKGADLTLLSIEAVACGQNVKLKGYEFFIPVSGHFQIMNVLCAVGLVHSLGFEMDKIMAVLPQLKAPSGRMEFVCAHNGAEVYIDYAHTPDALENALKSLKSHVRSKLAVVFGCGGDRDKGKRPMMGKIAFELADRIYVTDDNPRSEDPAVIRAEVLAGCKGGIDAGNRENAIRMAMSDLSEGDVLLVAGKGHENYQVIGDKSFEFDDKVMIRKYA